MKRSMKMTALVLAMMLVLAGCAKKETVESVSEEKTVETSVETSTETSAEASVETSTETSTEASVEEVVEASVETSVETSTETSTEKTVEVLSDESLTLEEYLMAHPEAVQDFKSQEESAEGLEIKIEGNTVYFNYSVPFAVDESTKGMYEEVVRNALLDESTVKTAITGIKLMQSGYGVDGLIIVYTYLDENGVVIFSAKMNDEGFIEE